MSKELEALKELELVENWIRDRELKISNVIKPSLNTIKQALLKAQEQEKVLEIIKKHSVNTGDLDIIISCHKNRALQLYNECFDNRRRWLKEEEFDLLKEYLK